MGISRLLKKRNEIFNVYLIESSIDSNLIKYFKKTIFKKIPEYTYSDCHFDFIHTN
jgi:hypothetical protein